METWEPTLNLPPIKISEREERLIIEQDEKVKSLLKDKILLDKEFNSLIYSILSNTERIKKTSEMMLPSEWVRFFKDFFKETPEKNLSFIKEQNNKRKNLIIQLDREIINILDSFEKNKTKPLNILENHSFILCKQCESLICKDRFKECSCPVCGCSINTNEKYEELPVHIFSERMFKFIESNIWLERGISNLLYEQGFLTKTGIYILGHSGVKHEIDNFAESKKRGFRIIDECKARDIKVSDIFVLSGKMQDTGVSTGYLFTTSSDVNKELIKLARFKNITIIDSILERENEEIINLLFI